MGILDGFFPGPSQDVKKERARLYRKFIEKADEAIEIKRKFNERKATRKELEEAKKKVYDAFTRLQDHRNFWGLSTRHEYDKMSGDKIYKTFFVDRYPDTTNFDDDPGYDDPGYDDPDYNDPDYYTPPDISSDEWDDTYRTEDERRKAKKKEAERKKKEAAALWRKNEYDKEYIKHARKEAARKKKEAAANPRPNKPRLKTKRKTAVDPHDLSKKTNISGRDTKQVLYLNHYERLQKEREEERIARKEQERKRREQERKLREQRRKLLEQKRNRRGSILVAYTGKLKF